METSLMEKKTFASAFRKLLPFIGLAIVVVFFQIVSGGKLLTMRNMRSLTNEIFKIFIGASGLAFLMSQNCIDFSIGANVAISCAFAAKVAVIQPILALPVGIITGLCIGFFNGVLHAKLHIMSFIATLAMSFVLKGLVIFILGDGSLSAPYSMLDWDRVWVRFAVMVLVGCIGFVVFEKTRLGKHCKAIGSNIDAARQSGVNIDKIKVIGFTIAGGLSGLVAFFSLIRSATASSSTGTGFEVNALNALLVGGMPLTGGSAAKFQSVLIGSLIMAVISSGMTNWGLGMKEQQIVKGIIFLVAISLTIDRKGMAVIK